MSSSATIVNLLTLKEAAEELRVSKGTVLRAVNGTLPGTLRLPSVRLGRRIMIRVESLARYVEAVEGVKSPA